MNIEITFEDETTAELLETEVTLETNENETADAVDDEEESHDDEEEIHDDENGENGDEV
jgi:hypothetical protein